MTGTMLWMPPTMRNTVNTAEFNVYQRQWDIVPMDALKKAHVTIVGVGGLGSFAALALAKMGVGTLTLVDGDTVEEHNVANQLYGPEQLGLLKVEACRDNLRRLNGAGNIHTWGFMLDKDNL